MIVVSVERNRFLQQHLGQTHQDLVVPSAVPREGTIQRLYKEFVQHDEDGEALGRIHERTQTVVTVVRVQDPSDVLDLGLDVAQGCGFKTVQGLQEAWRGRHPRTALAAVVWFVVGDWRDRDVFMNWSGRAGGEIGGYGSGYTRNSRRAMDRDAPVLSREQIDALSLANYQKDEARRAKASRALADESASQRLERIQRYVDDVRSRLGEGAARQVEYTVRQEMRIVAQRIERAERRPR